jgi:uncharacterized protein (TIGR02466 family)
MQIENIFPIPLAFFDVPKEIIDSSVSIANTYIDSKKWREQPHYGTTITNYHSDSTRNYIGHFDNTLGEYLNNVCRMYLEYTGFNPTSNMRIESWLNLNLPNTHHSRHEHFGCFMSGVLWLAAGLDSGNFNIHDPIGVRAQNVTQYRFAKSKTTSYNKDIFAIVPQPGKLILFPSWLQHQVESNKGNDDRISIAFNIWMAQ